MLIQTKRCKDALENVGFKWRKDFRIYTPFDRSVMGYGKTKVFLKTNRAVKMAIDKADEIAKTGEFDVLIVEFNSGKIFPFIEEGSGEVRYLRGI